MTIVGQLFPRIGLFGPDHRPYLGRSRPTSPNLVRNRGTSGRNRQTSGQHRHRIDQMLSELDRSCAKLCLIGTEFGHFGAISPHTARPVFRQAPEMVPTLCVVEAWFRRRVDLQEARLLGSLRSARCKRAPTRPDTMFEQVLVSKVSAPSGLPPLDEGAQPLMPSLICRRMWTESQLDRGTCGEHSLMSHTQGHSIDVPAV